MRNRRPKLVLKKLDKLEEKTLKRIDSLQRNVLEIRALRIRLSASELGSKTPAI